MKDIVIAITAASYSGNKGAAAMLQSSIKQLYKKYGKRLKINLMSVYPDEDKDQIPFDFINIVSCTPQQLLFVAFPLAILYALFGWIKPIGKLLCKNKILRAYKNTDFVLDEAGISFVDSRGIVMNTYAFVCAAVPIMMGSRVIKYSQAMGPFKNPINKILAKIILPKLKLICARGEITLENLKGIKISDNVKLCADGAFTMEDDEKIAKMVEEDCAKDDFFTEKVAGLSISSVVNKKCTKMNIDYIGETVKFIDYLNEKGYNVFIIANAARINSTKPRNNDLMVGDEIYEKVADKSKVRWYHKEMDAEEIREYIARCEFVVASRFHAMIGSLQKKVPVLLVGWSHKYKEVLDMFELGQFAIDFSKLEINYLKEKFDDFEKNLGGIKASIEKNYDTVIASSKKNIEYATEIIDDFDQNRDDVIKAEKKKKKKKIVSVVKFIFLALVLYYLVRFFKRNISEIREEHIKINWFWFTMAILMYFVYKTTQAFLWHYITKLNKCSIKASTAVTTYLYSTLGRYIPGKVFTLAARFPAYDEQGVPMRKVTICFLLENLCTLFGAAFLFLISLIFFPRERLLTLIRYVVPNSISDSTAVLVFIAAIAVIVVVFFIMINPKILNFFFGIIEKITHKKDLIIEINYPDMIKVVICFILNWIICGIGFYMLVNSFNPINASEFLFVGGVYGLAVTVGFFAVFAPSGIGVREWVMIFAFTTLTGLMSNGMAGIISVVARLWASVAELLLIAMAAMVNKFVINKNK
ncbi:MAG: hypothetical protein E7254_04440 [Lachnospiraceae bacterium]|nr:hypothetical protein [Lachnospiraceae bacterium]